MLRWFNQRGALLAGLIVFLLGPVWSATDTTFYLPAGQQTAAPRLPTDNPNLQLDQVDATPGVRNSPAVNCQFGSGAQVPQCLTRAGYVPYSSVVSFSRAGNAMQYDSTGTLTYAPNNQLLQSNTFSNASWDKQNTSVTGGQADPFGGTTAWSVSDGVASNFHLLRQNSIALSGPNLFAFYAKQGSGGRYVALGSNVGGVVSSFAVFDLQGGTIVQSSGGSFYGMAAVPNASGWYLIYVISQTNTGNSSQTLAMSNSATPGSGIINGGVTYAGANNTIIVCNALFSNVTHETSPRSGDQVVTTSAAYFGPRFDYDPVTLLPKGLLIEEARTNLLLQSNSLGTTPWSSANGVSIAQNAAAPDGTNTAWTITQTGANGSDSRQLQSFTIANDSTSWTTSTYVAKSGSSAFALIKLQLTGGTSVQQLINLNTQTGVFTNPSSTGSSTVASVGNFWLITSTIANNSSGNTSLGVGWYPSTNSSAASLNGGSSIWSFGKLENAAFATSYIPTAAASVTRAADAAQLTGQALAALQGAAWSILIEGDATTPSTSPVLVGGNNSITLLGITSGEAGATFNGTLLNTANTAAWTSGVFSRVGLAYAAGSRRIAMNGGPVASDTVSIVAITSATLWGFTSSSIADGHVRSLGLYNRQLANSVLQAKSIVGAPY